MSVPPMFSVGCKVSRTPVDFNAKLGPYLADELGEDPTKYSAGVNTVVTLRAAVAGNDAGLIASQSSIDKVNRYVGNLEVLRKHFPVNQGEKWNGVAPMPLEFNFVWTDLFPPAGMFTKSESTSSNFNFEVFAVIFNLGALHSQIGKNEPMTDDNSLKSAAINFQAAANTFARLDEEVKAKCVNSPSPDFDSSLLTGLSAIMAAQAQESLWLKVVNAKMKSGIIAKIAKQCSVDYTTAGRALRAHQALGKKWAKVAAAKEVFFNAEANFWQSKQDNDDGEYGHEVTRLRETLRLLQTCSSDLDIAKMKQSAVNATFQKQHKLLEQVYTDKRETMVDNLPPIIPQSMVKLDKPLPDFASPQICGEDLFGDLLPMPVSKAKSKYEEQRDEKTKELIEKLRNSTQETWTKLNEWNLPGSIELEENPGGIPQSLIDNSREVIAQGGITKITDMIQAMPGLREEAASIIEDSVKMLDLEEEEDKQLKNKHGSKWSRTPSADLNGPTRNEGTKLSTVLSNAGQSDGTLMAQFEANRDGISTMSQSPEQLESLLPSPERMSSTTGGLSELKSLLNQLDSLRTQRDDLEKEIEAEKGVDDITQRLLSSTSIEESSIFGEQLTRYAPFESRVDELVAESSETLNATKVANEAFVLSRGNDNSSDREKMISTLQSNFIAYKELMENATGGTKFYNDLIRLAKQYQTKVKDFCSARTDEKASLLGDINRSIAATPTESYGSAAPAAAAAATATNFPGSQPPLPVYQPSNPGYSQPGYSQQPAYNQPQYPTQYSQQPPGYGPGQSQQYQPPQYQQSPYGQQQAPYAQPPQQSQAYQARTPEQKRAAAGQAFRMYDGGSGFLDQNGFYGAMTYLGSGLTWEDSQVIFQIYDVAGQGRLNINSFVENYAQGAS